MSLVVMGASYKTAPLEARERIAVPEKDLPQALRALAESEGVKEALVLSTCNRTEAYVDAKTDRLGAEALRRFFAERCGSKGGERNASRTGQANGTESADPLCSGNGTSTASAAGGRIAGSANGTSDIFEDCFYLHRGVDAVQHVFRVVSSLDSQVLGEAQILGQTKRAFEAATRERTCAKTLTKLFKSAIHLGKRVRSETAIGEDSVSLSTVALKIAREHFPLLESCRVLIVGAGEMARLTAVYLSEASVSNVMVTSRTHAHACAFAEEFGMQTVPFDERYSALAEADIAFTMTSSPDPVIEVAALLAARKAARTGANPRKLLLIDEALPRNVDPACSQLPGVQVCDLDALTSVVDEGLARRMAAIGDAERLIAAETETFLAWMQERYVTPTIKEIHAKAEAVAAAEVARAAKMLVRQRGCALSEEELAVLDALGRSIAGKLMHGPTIRLRKEAQTADSYYYTGAARYLFGLETFPLGTTRSCCEEQSCATGGACTKRKRLTA